MLALKSPRSPQKRSVGRRRRRRCARTHKQKGRTGFRERHRMKHNRVTLLNRRRGTRVRRRGGVVPLPSLTNVFSYENLENELSTPINQSPIKILNTIGEGAHGRIYEVKFGTDIRCALKYMLKTNNSEQLYLNEVSCIQTLHDSELFPNLIAHGATANAYFLCIPLYKQDLLTYLSETHTRLMLTEEKLTAMEKLKSYAHQILEAINYMHSKSILHLDLKLENIMLTNEDSNEDSKVVIIDFGMAKILTDTQE